MPCKSQMQPDEVEQVKTLIIEAYEDGVSIADIVANTSVDDRATAKAILRQFIDRGLVSSTPDWRYKASTKLRRTATLPD